MFNDIRKGRLFVRMIKTIRNKTMLQASRLFKPFLLVSSIFILVILPASCVSGSGVRSDAGGRRIVTVGGSVTETAYALGADDEIIGTDTSSVFPEKATKLPQVGYQRRLSPEGVLSLKPTMLLTTSLAGTPTALNQIESAGVKVEKVANDNSVEGAKVQIRQIARVLDRVDKGDELIQRLDADLRKARECVDSLAAKPKPNVLFIHARGASVVNVAGLNTAGDEMIKLSGGVNVISEFEGYKPMTAETIVSVAPDLIVLPERSLASIGGKDGLLKMPGIAETPAGKTGRIVTIDDLLLLGFGPRLGIAINELCRKMR
ncbi:MAG: hemin ABC transporter substrate-binding protein [Acidobacteria bacterium]|nr:hemin ABC transporter substrate-binding protein [Acidobacteriota bacterium]